MRIAVIGTGHVGGTLGGKFAAAGHEVVYGSRQAAGEGPGGAPVRAAGDALADAEVVLLAVPAQAVPDLIAEHGSELAGTIVIDAVNRIGEPETNSRTAIAQAAPTALYVRAFNTLGWENCADPPAGAALFFAADPGARPVAQELITVVGLHPEYVGGADAAGTVDGLLPLWFRWSSSTAGTAGWPCASWSNAGQAGGAAIGPNRGHAGPGQAGPAPAAPSARRSASRGPYAGPR